MQYGLTWLCCPQIEETNPLKKVQQQAANLRFILQAPKLKRGPDEVVNIPVLQIEERKKWALAAPYPYCLRRKINSSFCCQWL